MPKRKFYLICVPQHFDLIRDHWPLIPMLNSHTLDAIQNVQLQRLSKISVFVFADVRSPVSHPTPEEMLGRQAGC